MPGRRPMMNSTRGRVPVDAARAPRGAARCRRPAVAALRHTGRADAICRIDREDTLAASAVDDHGRNPRATRAAGRSRSTPRARARDPAEARQSASASGFEERADLRQLRRLRRKPAIGRDADDAIAEPKREQRLGDARRRGDDPRRRSPRWSATAERLIAHHRDQHNRQSRALDGIMALHYQAREKRLPVLPVDVAQRAADAGVELELAAEQPQQIGQAVHVRAASPAGRPRPASCSRTMARSARRQIVRARRRTRTRRGARRESTSPRASPRSPRCRWTSAVSRSSQRGDRSTICGFGLSAGVASEDPILKRSCWIAFVNAAISASSQIDRANPERRVQFVDRAAASRRAPTPSRRGRRPRGWSLRRRPASC